MDARNIVPMEAMSKRCEVFQKDFNIEYSGTLMMAQLSFIKHTLFDAGNLAEEPGILLPVVGEVNSFIGVEVWRRL